MIWAVPYAICVFFGLFTEALMGLDQAKDAMKRRYKKHRAKQHHTTEAVTPHMAAIPIKANSVTPRNGHTIVAPTHAPSLERIAT